VGYKWFDLKGLTPLYPFGYGLSYTRFAYSDLAGAVQDGALHARFTVTNSGSRDGAATPQIYVSPEAGGWEAPKRLGGWKKLALKPGASASVDVTIDPRLLAVFDSASKTWRIAEGDYDLILAQSAAEPVRTVKVHLPARSLDVRGQ